ncbi:MAG: LppX_LprAFG lipoprotein [SAR202 cluster bacterium]|nr:LppX_LprAFG lipoprotein [SAR202 cluster bacterium]
MQRFPLFLISVFTLLSASILLASCGGSDAATPTPSPPPPPPPPQEMLSTSAARMASLKSLTFSMTHEKGVSPLMSGVVMESMDGQAALPDRFSLDVKAQATALRAFINIKILAASGKTYMTDPVSGRLQEVDPSTLPFNFTNLGGTLAGIINAMMSPLPRGIETVDGKQAQKIVGPVLSQNLSGLVPKAAQGLPVGLEVWIEENTTLLLRARISGPVVSNDPPDIIRVLTFHNFDTPITITSPV